MLRATFLTAVLLMPLVSGCSTDCEVTCEAVKDCPQAESIFTAIDCGDGCDFQTDFSESAGCGAEWDAFNACGAANTDLACEAGTCGAEALAWSNCLNPDDGS